MGGSSGQQQEQRQQSQTGPWAPAVDSLQGILGGIKGNIGNYNPTSQETGALNTLMSNAQSGNPYAPAIQDYATNLLSGGGANAQAPQVQGAYDTYAKNIAPWASGALADPTQNPALRQMLDTIQSDVGNSINSQFAAAGRDLSGANQQAYGRGIAQGFAPTLLAAQQQGLQSASDLYNAGNNTAGLLTGLNQTALGNQGQGVSAADSALQARDSSANQILNVAGQQRQLPLQNLGLLSNLTIPIAQLGQQSSGSSSGSMTAQMSPTQQFAMIASGLGSLGGLWGGKK